MFNNIVVKLTYNRKQICKLCKFKNTLEYIMYVIEISIFIHSTIAFLNTPTHKYLQNYIGLTKSILEITCLLETYICV